MTDKQPAAATAMQPPAHPEPAKPSAPPGGGRGGEAPGPATPPLEPRAAEVIPSPQHPHEAPPGEARVLAGAPGVSVAVHGGGPQPGHAPGPVQSGKVKVSVPHAATPQHVQATLRVKASDSAGGTLYPGTVPRQSLRGLYDYCTQSLEQQPSNIPLRAVREELGRILDAS